MNIEKIHEQADKYIGYPEESDESLETYATRKAFIDGAVWMQEELIRGCYMRHANNPKIKVGSISAYIDDCMRNHNFCPTIEDFILNADKFERV